MYGIYCTEARGPCARGLRAINVIHPSARDITILYPVGTATIVTIDIDVDLSFATKRDTNEQGYLAVL